MLKLELTDGLQTIFAIEYSPIRQLSVNIKPGEKVIALAYQGRFEQLSFMMHTSHM